MLRLLAFLFLLPASTLLNAQTAPLFQAAELRVEWELLQNQYQGKSQTLSKLRLHNSGKTRIPAKGWSLYFNFVRPILPESSRAQGFSVEQLSGDWFRMQALDNFSSIAPGAKLELDWVSEAWLINRTDAPIGFYVVFDSNPEKGYPLEPVTIVPPARPDLMRRSAEDQKLPATAVELFQKNESTTDIPAANLPPIFPTPVSLDKQAGADIIEGNTPISAEPEFLREAELLAASWPIWFGKNTQANTGRNEHPVGISLRKSAAVLHPEGYTLAISADKGVVISAATPAGIFYGIQSLKSLLPPELWQKPANTVPLPCLNLRDEPRFGYRGLHVDIARNFQPASEIIKLLDVMSLYKLNKLHFHFSDDEGWRLEIADLPELTEVGSQRGHASSERQWLHPAYGSGPEPGKNYGSGYYSRETFVQILKYAAERHIEVIPEIELPGHARAAIKAMEARYERLMRENRPAEARQYRLVDPEDRSVYRSVQWYNDNVVCVGLPSTYAFVEKVTDELIAMYRQAGAPLSTIHLGGDEVPGGVWEKSPACQQVMQAGAMSETSELWYYFWKKMRDMLDKRGLQVSGWEEAGLRKTQLDGNTHYLPNPDFADDHFHMYVWNNVLGWGAEDLAYRMANAGYPVVLGPVSNLYFDMAYQKDFNEPGYYWGAYADVDKAFGFIPFDYFKTANEDLLGNPIDPSIFIGKSRLTEYGKKNILGLEGLIWSETLNGPATLEYMVFPKLLGLAERAWGPAPVWETTQDKVVFQKQYAESWSQFANQLGKREL
ncbi:MAG: carbohydate-binding domain-containing protein, partial [Saprospiraceae bacterium]|nr:carbohydate-binding domain-containing protein [Saprospiraceae bacterium]